MSTRDFRDFQTSSHTVGAQFRVHFVTFILTHNSNTDSDVGPRPHGMSESNRATGGSCWPESLGTLSRGSVDTDSIAAQPYFFGFILVIAHRQPQE